MYDLLYNAIVLVSVLSVGITVIGLILNARNN